MSKYTTEMAIGVAFKQLLLEKPVTKITINDIAQKAGINRQTFYYHFRDIIELVEWLCNVDAEEALKQNRTYDTWQEGFLSIFRKIREGEPYVRNLHRYVPKTYFYNYLYKVTFHLLYDVIEEKSVGLPVSEEDKVFIAEFYKFGFVGLVIDWLDSDMKEDPQVIIDKLNALITGTFDHALQNAARKHENLNKNGKMS